MPKYEYKNPNRLVHRNYTPIATYLRARDFRDNGLWSCKNGRLTTFVDGEELSEQEFNQRWPVPVSINFTMNPENSDKTKGYLMG